MRGIAGLAFASAFLCAGDAANAAEQFNPAGNWVCDGEFRRLGGGPGRGIPPRTVMGVLLEISATEVSLTGDSSFGGTYAINPAATTVREVSFSGSRNRSGWLRSDGTAAVIQMELVGDRVLSRIELNCRVGTAARDTSSNRFGPGR